MKKILYIMIVTFLFSQEPYEGYVLYTPGGGGGGGSATTYLRDIDNSIYNSWSHATGAASMPYLHPGDEPGFENTLLYYSNRLGYAGRNTIHGFRTVASTALHESGKWHHDAVELQMSHLVGTKVSRAYNKAEHLEERRRMMQWWSDYIDSLMIPANVIDITKKSRKAV